MAKEEKKVLKGKELWSKLEGKKEEISEKVPVQLGDVVGEVTVIYRDIDMVQDIIEEYREKEPKKPTIEIKFSGENKKIEVPNEDDKFKVFNKKPEAQELIKEWEKECKPIIKERNYRLAYEFMKKDERPSNDPDEGVKILQSALSYSDALEIVDVGNDLNSFNKRLDKATKNS